MSEEPSQRVGGNGALFGHAGPPLQLLGTPPALSPRQHILPLRRCPSPFSLRLCPCQRAPSTSPCPHPQLGTFLSLPDSGSLDTKPDLEPQKRHSLSTESSLPTPGLASPTSDYLLPSSSSNYSSQPWPGRGLAQLLSLSQGPVTSVVFKDKI